MCFLYFRLSIKQNIEKRTKELKLDKELMKVVNFY